MKYVWLTNIQNPHKPCLAKEPSELDPSAVSDLGSWKAWILTKAIGEPKSVEGLSTEQLKAEGYVGVYKLI